MKVSSILCSLLVGTFLCTHVHGYVAAVSQHVAIELDTPKATVEKNLEIYMMHVREARVRGADILVLPEFGLGGNFDSRDDLYPYLENIPDVVGQRVVLCDQPDRAQFPWSANVSCAARDNNITVAIEMYDLKPCSQNTDPNCPSDGRYQYNTEVVYGPDGSMIAKYYKTHEWIPLKKAIDEPVNQPLIIFNTTFGVQFGIFMCFDIMFPSPAVELVEAGIKHFVYSVAMNANLGMQVHRQWSSKHNAVLLSSNLGEKWSSIHDSGNDCETGRYPIAGIATDSVVIGVVNAERYN